MKRLRSFGFSSYDRWKKTDERQAERLFFQRLFFMRR